MSAFSGLKIGDFKNFSDFFYILKEAFPKTTAGISAYVKAIKAADGVTGKFKASFTGLGAAMEANPVGVVIAGIVALIAVIKAADYFIDKANDSTDELLEKKDKITKNISEINSELENIDNQIAELNKQKLNITDSSDISALNTQIDLLQQRKELLEWKAQNDRKENENNAKDIIESTKNDSVDSGASYMDGVSGKLSKWQSFIYSRSGLSSYSAETYVDSLDLRLSSIHPQELENVVDNLNEIYDTYDKIVQDDTLIGSESYYIAIEKQKQINELLQRTQYLRSVRNNLDEEYINSNELGAGWFTDYNKRLSSIIENAYSNGGVVTIEDVKNQFGGSTSLLETELEEQGRTLEDYVTWLNAASASQIKFLNGSNVNSSTTSFKSYSKLLDEYKNTLSEIQQKNIDLSKTQFGNIDTNNRQPLEWNELNLSKFKNELMSWNEDGSWDKIKNDIQGSVLTTYAHVAEFDNIPIAFSPILQTEDGAKLLSKKTVDDYITSLINYATEDDGQWTFDELLRLDTIGFNVEGQKIKGIIADIGDTAYETSETLHYMGNAGDLGQLKSELSKIIESMPTVDLESETESFTKLNSAIKETSGATGLTTESIAILKSRFKELSQYDADKLFENTSNGVRVNRKELEKLEHQQEQITKTNLDTKLNALKEKYKLLTTEMDNCNDKSSVSYLSLVQQRNAIVDDINATSELAAQYRGLTSEYQKWIDSQSNGEDGDMYDSIRNGLGKAKELFESGLVGTNEFRDYVDLLSGKDLSTASVDEIVATYKELWNTIKGASYSATDFLKEGSSGVENALNALQQLNKDWANQNNGEWSLNIPIDEAAEKLGISAEYLEAILKKSKDFGITVNYNDVDLAIEKIKNLNEVSENAAKSLKENKLTDIDFNFETSNIEEVNYQLEGINDIVDGLRDKDGKLNLDSEDVKNAELVLFSLLKRKSELEQPSIMNIDVSTPANDAEYAVKKIKDLHSAIEELSALNKLNEKGFDVDTSEAEEKVKNLAGEINNLPENIKSSLNLNTDEAINALASLNNADISAGVHLNQSDIDAIETSISGITPEMTIEAGVDETKVLKFQNEEHTAKGNVTFDVNKLASNINMYAWNVPTRRGKVIYEATGGDNLNGTISGKHKLNGTLNQFGEANASGNWGAKRTETSLMGEIAPEIWVHSDTGKWELVNYPQFRKVKKGDIIFNGSQTKELLNSGSTNAFGNAFLGGTAYSGEVSGGGELYSSTNSSDSSSKSSSSKSSSSKSSSNSSDKDEKEPQIFDWIEIALNRIQRAISNLSKKAESTFKKLSTRLSATNQEITKINEEITLQQKAADRYIKQANSVGLSSSLAAKVRNGTIEISEYSSETQELIKQYQEWYEKSLKCSDAIQELHETLASLYEDKFNNIVDDFDNQLKLLEHLTNTYEAGIDKLEAKGYLESTKYYTALQDVEKQNISVLNKELTELQKSLSEAMNSGEIDEFSDAWYSMQISINDTKEAIDEANISLLEYAKTMREIEWGYFDYIQDRISQLTQESDFLIDLMSKSDLYDDRGQFSDTGIASMGLHAMNYNVYMAQADQYAKELQEIEKEIAKDPYNTDLIERREELLELQQKSISAAEDEKQAIIDLVEEGINIELNALKELIDTYTDALDAQKDLYDYQKKIASKTSDIASLQKQLSAYSNDISEETRAKIQKLQVELSKAQEDLEQTEYEQYISDQKKLLNDLYDEYEEILNQRLDNIELLMSDMIDMANVNTELINNTLHEVADSVGYTLTDNMQSVWDGATNAIDGTLSFYGDGFSEKLTAINNVLNSIQANVAAMVAASDKEANSTTSSATTTTKTTSGSSSSNSSSSNKSSSSSSSSSTSKTITVGGKINAGSAKIYSDSYGGGKQNQYYASDPIYTVLKESNGYLQVRYHKLSSGVTGWFKKSDVKAYKTGGLVDYTGLAQLDGTPQKPELVLNSKDTENFLALRDVLRNMTQQELSIQRNGYAYKYDASQLVPQFTGIPDLNGKTFTVGTPNTSQNIDIKFGDIVIDHVEDYNDFVTQLQHDKQFEKMVQAMTIDRAIGGSSFAKFKFR